MEKIELKYIISLSSDLSSIDNLINVLQSRSSLYINFKGDNKKTNKTKAKIILNEYKIENELFIQKINVNSKSSKQYFILKSSFDEIEKAEKLNREIKITIANFNDANIDLLNDGISKYYSTKAYERLHDIENMIRAFITEMMLFYGNPDWVKKDAKEILNLKDTDISKGNKILYSRNFDQLREFLFTDYSDNTYKEIIDKVLNFDKNLKVSNLISSLSPELPQTNWDKILKSKAR